MSGQTLGPWEVESRNLNSQEQTHWVVVDADGCVLFDTFNADTRRFVIDTDPDEDGMTYRQTGPAADALRLACCAPDLLEATKAAFHLCEALLASRMRVGTSIGFVGPTPDLVEEVRDACRAALDKVEG
jgi:hypothetical protein